MKDNWFSLLCFVLLASVVIGSHIASERHLNRPPQQVSISGISLGMSSQRVLSAFGVASQTEKDFSQFDFSDGSRIIVGYTNHRIDALQASASENSVASKQGSQIIHLKVGSQRLDYGDTYWTCRKVLGRPDQLREGGDTSEVIYLKEQVTIVFFKDRILCMSIDPYCSKRVDLVNSRNKFTLSGADPLIAVVRHEEGAIHCVD